MRLLILLALLAPGAWFAPQFAEGANAPCPALEQRIAALVKAEGSRLATDLAADAPIAGLLGIIRGALADASRGALADAYVRDRFPQLPPDLACIAAWWKLRFDPDLAPIMRGLLPR